MMERLIDDLLDSSRLDYQGVQLRFEAIDTNALVAGVLETLRAEIAAAGAAVKVDKLPSIKGDSWALTKVFMNLIGNSLQYRAADRAPAIRVYAREDIGRTIFVVEDNGIGIPEGDRERVFRRFERGSNASAKSGTGLGLHIVREIAMGHGGSVWLEPGERCGTRFLVSVPLEPVMPPHSSLSNVEPVA
jgi:signal transduction histidine kinase